MTTYSLIEEDGNLVVVMATFGDGNTSRLWLSHPNWELLKFKQSLIGKVATESDIDKLVELAVENEQHERSFDED